MKELINFQDNPLTHLDKTAIDCKVGDIILSIPPKQSLEAMELIYKFEYLLSQLKTSVLKERAKKDFLDKFGGQTNVSDGQCKLSLALIKKYEFSDKVAELENKKKKIEADIKAQKEKEKIDGIAKVEIEETQFRIQVL